MKPSKSEAAACATVLYDGSCPLCRREIGLYQRAEGAAAVDWRDVSQPGSMPSGLTQAEAMARFHVIDAAGEMRSGAHAFIALWLSLPGWRWLGRIASLPPLPLLLEGLYRCFLTVRPLIQKAFNRRPAA